MTELRAGEDSRPEASPARLEAVVSGRVQGVGFRRYVRNWGRKLELTGWVRNEPDGTVRLVAEGERAQLDRLVRLLWGGPPPARVEDVVTSWREAEGVFEAFEISHVPAVGRL
ncbi:MAG: acylphosphatase [Rubricoccaceae bacterium]